MRSAKWSLEVLLVLAALTLGGCVGTIVPHPVEAAAPSVDLSGEADSGVRRLVPWSVPGQPAKEYAAVLSEGGKDRYNALAKLYGQGKGPSGLPNFLFKVAPGVGLTPNPDGTWTLDPPHLEAFGLMEGWYRQGRPST